MDEYIYLIYRSDLECANLEGVFSHSDDAIRAAKELFNLNTGEYSKFDTYEVIRVPMNTSWGLARSPEVTIWRKNYDGS